MPLTQFAVLLGLYDKDYVDIKEYAQRFTNYTPGLTPNQVFHDLCGGI